MKRGPKYLAWGDGMYDKKAESFIDSYWRKHFCAPSFREIMKAVRGKSTASMSSVVRRYRKYGCGRREKVKSRQIVPNWVVDAISNYKPEQK